MFEGTLRRSPAWREPRTFGPLLCWWSAPWSNGRSELAWFESLPLFGQRIVVTRPVDEAERSAAVLESLGAEVLLAPTVQILPVADPGPLDEAIDHLGDYDWLVFTSGNGVRFFLERLFARGRDVRALGHLRLAAIGPGTAQALLGLPPPGRPRPRVVSLGSPWPRPSRPGPPGRRSCSLAPIAAGPCSRTSWRRWPRSIRSPSTSNADVESLPEAVLERISAGTVDWITLTSSAIAARLHALLPEPARSRIGRKSGWPASAR